MFVLVELGQYDILQALIHHLHDLLVDPADVNFDADAIVALTQVLPLLFLLIQTMPAVYFM